METFAYFPSLIYRDEKPEWVSAVKEVSDRYLNAVPHPEYPVVQGNDMRLDLGWLCMHLAGEAREILSSQGYDVDGYDIHISDMWPQSIGRHGTNILHSHGNTQISGLYFLEFPEGGAYPMFGDPRPGNTMSCLRDIPSEEIKASTPFVHFNNVVPGTILFFNSFLPHMISISQADERTIFIHFMATATRRG